MIEDIKREILQNATYLRLSPSKEDNYKVDINVVFEILDKYKYVLEKLESQRIEALKYIAYILNSEDRQYLSIGYDDLDRVYDILVEGGDNE